MAASATASAVQDRFIETPSSFLTTPAVPGPTCLRERGEPVAPAHFGGEMPNSYCALTKTKLGFGERRPAAIHPCGRPHFATNLGTRATLHDYHLDGDKVNADSGRIADEVRIAFAYRPIVRGRNNVQAILLFRAERCDRCAHELLDTGPALPIVDRQGACGAITCQG